MSATNCSSKAPSQDLSTGLQLLADRFEDAWQSGQRPQIDEYLPPEGPDRRTLLVELVHVDLERRLKAGEAVRVEQYLERYSELAVDQALVLNLLASEFALRRRSEPNLLLEDYLQRFPLLGEALLAQLATDQPQSSLPVSTVEKNPAVPPIGDGDQDAGAEVGRASWARYRTLCFHAKGNMGEVHIAEDTELDRKVALKRIQEQYGQEPECRQRFLREAKLTARLEHPGVVPVHGLVHDAEGKPCYAMRFIEGESLEAAIQRFHEAGKGQRDPGEQNLAFRKLLTRFVAVCHTMAYAHKCGIVHRDIKPANIMLGDYGETLVVDWGLAKWWPGTDVRSSEEKSAPARDDRRPPTEGSPDTRRGRLIGTPAFMSPEQAAGRIDLISPSSDICSLGATLYVLLTGLAPFDGNIYELLARVQRGEFPRPRQRNTAVPPALEAVCLKAMALKPEERYATAAHLGDDLEHWLADEPVAAYPEPWGVRGRRWVGHHSHLVASVLAALLVGTVSLAVLAWFLSTANERERQAKELVQEHKARAEENYHLAREAVDDFSAKVSREPRFQEEDLHELRVQLLRSALGFYQQFVLHRPHDEGLHTERARAYQHLGVLTQETGSAEAAIAFLQQSLDLFGKLARQDPTASEYQEGLATGYLALGTLYRRLNSPHQAEATYQKARDLFDDLARAQPTMVAYQIGLAKSDNNRGVLYLNTGQMDRAALAFGKSRDAWAKLARDHPSVQDYQSGLGASYVNLNQLYERSDEDIKAEDARQRAIDVFTKLAGAYPRVAEYQLNLSRCYNNLGMFYTDHRRYKQAEEPLRKQGELVKSSVASRLRP